MEFFTLRFRDDNEDLTKTVVKASDRGDAVNQFRSIYPTNLLYYCISNKDLELHGTPEEQS